MEQYDVTITIKKALTVFLLAGIPAGLFAIANLPELIIFAPFIAAIAEAVRNYLKNKDN